MYEPNPTERPTTLSKTQRQIWGEGGEGGEAVGPSPENGLPACAISFPADGYNLQALCSPEYKYSLCFSTSGSGVAATVCNRDIHYCFCQIVKKTWIQKGLATIINHAPERRRSRRRRKKRRRRMKKKREEEEEE